MMNSIILLVKSKKPGILIRILCEKIFLPRLTNFGSLVPLFQHKSGIEIGGPSGFFRKGGYMPIYPIAGSVDGCNFSASTVWEGNLTEGITYHYQQGKTGTQYICDAVGVEKIPQKKYDFILSCNSLEHIANPLKAVENWIKLLKPAGGSILLILPRKESNFDHKRPVTLFEHLVSDYRNNVNETDLTHLPEILKLHDLKYDPLAGSFENFKMRSENNFDNRCLHHHVFDLDLLDQVCNYFKLRVVLKTSRTNDHIIVAVTK